MAFSSKLDNLVLSAFKPQNSIFPLSIQSYSFLPSSSFKPQKLPFRIRYASTIRATSSPASPSTTIAEPEGIKIKSIPTKPIEGQKTGTSGLRKKVAAMWGFSTTPMMKSNEIEASRCSFSVYTTLLEFRV